MQHFSIFSCGCKQPNLSTFRGQSYYFFITLQNYFFLLARTERKKQMILRAAPARVNARQSRTDAPGMNRNTAAAAKKIALQASMRCQRLSLMSFDRHGLNSADTRQIAAPMVKVYLNAGELLNPPWRRGIITAMAMQSRPSDEVRAVIDARRVGVILLVDYKYVLVGTVHVILFADDLLHQCGVGGYAAIEFFIIGEGVLLG